VPSHAFQTAFKANPATWTAASLDDCSIVELRTLARLLGIPEGTTKADRIERLLETAELRLTLSRFPDGRAGAEQLVATYKGNVLREWCRQVHGWIGPTKMDRAIVLINWRTKCRKDGQAFLAELRANKSPQIRMDI
jgi:hypothetical protein